MYILPNKRFILSEPFYRNDPKFSDSYAWANSADPDQTDLHVLDSLLYGRATQFKF